MSGQPPHNPYYDLYHDYRYQPLESNYYPNHTGMNGPDLLALFSSFPPPSAVPDSAIHDRTSEITSSSGNNVRLQPGSSKKAKIEPPGPCVVCETDKAGYHFGVHACAACSAFFRRTISENRKYVCRKSGSDHLNCPIDKRHRCYCRACRLQKCLAKGMDPAAVQPHRDSIGSKAKVCPPYSRLSPPSINETVENSSSNDLTRPLFVRTDFPSDHENIENLIIPKNELSESDPYSQRSRDCHSTSSDESSIYSGYDPRKNLIELTVTEYRKLIERRRLFYCSSSVRDILGGTHLVALIKHLSVSWSILDKYYCTMKYGGLQTNRIIHCDGTYTDLEDPNAEFDANSIAGEELDKETLNKLFITPLRDALREISEPMYYFQMTDVEFCALTAILLFDPNIRGLSATTIPIMKDARDRVYQDWFAYYKGHDILDASERIGNTMLLLPAVKTTVEKTAENMRLIRLFELFDYDPIVDDLFQ